LLRLNPNSILIIDYIPLPLYSSIFTLITPLYTLYTLHFYLVERFFIIFYTFI
jgi:hypothetical protein